MDKEKLKQKYNKLLEREQKAIVFFGDDSIPRQDRDKYLGDYQHLLLELADTLQQIGFWTPDELQYGFGKENQDKFSLDTFN